MDAMKPVGGRGKQAPYTTSIVRVPDPIRGEVKSMIAEYRKAVFEGVDGCIDATTAYQKMLGVKGTPKSEAIEYAKTLPKRGRKTVTALEKLLQFLYNDSSISL